MTRPLSFDAWHSCAAREAPKSSHDGLTWPRIKNKGQHGWHGRWVQKQACYWMTRPAENTSLLISCQCGWRIGVIIAWNPVIIKLIFLVNYPPKSCNQGGVFLEGRFEIASKLFSICPNQEKISDMDRYLKARYDTFGLSLDPWWWIWNTSGIPPLYMHTTCFTYNSSMHHTCFNHNSLMHQNVIFWRVTLMHHTRTTQLVNIFFSR